MVKRILIAEPNLTLRAKMFGVLATEKYEVSCVDRWYNLARLLGNDGGGYDAAVINPVMLEMSVEEFEDQLRHFNIVFVASGQEYVTSRPILRHPLNRRDFLMMVDLVT